MFHRPTESSIIAVLLSQRGGSQSSSWTQLLVTDPLTGGTLEKRDAEGVDGRSLALVGSLPGDLYFITSSLTSRITIFPTNRSSTAVYSTHAPIRCLVSSPDGVYYAGGVKEKIHVWEGGTGALIAVISQHYQPVSALAFSPDGSYLVSGGDDGMILVWRFGLVISSAYTPRFSLLTVPRATQHEWSEARVKWTLAEHALPVTSLLCGLGGVRGLLFSAAVDHTCRIWDLLRGVCLFTVPISGVPTCLATDPMESSLLIGQKHGEVRKVRITFTPPQTVASLDGAENAHDGTTASSHHQTEVADLIALRDNIHFLSADVSGVLITWHTESLQPLRRMDLHAPVTALLLLPLAVSRAYSAQKGGDRMLTAAGFKPQPPARRIEETGEQGVCLLRTLRDVPIEEQTRRDEKMEQEDESQEFMNTQLANNDNFKKLTACIDGMFKQAVELDFNF